VQRLQAYRTHLLAKGRAREAAVVAQCIRLARSA